MRVASILCEDLSYVKTQLIKALPFCDVIELRLDYLKRIHIPDIKKLRNTIALPVIFTLRKKAQGGQCEMVEVERLAMLQKLAELQPDYLDLEFDTPAEFIFSLQKNYPTIQIIGSYHDFAQTPSDLERLYQTIYRPYFSIFKIATFANNLCDTLRLLIFLQKTSQMHRIIGMSMGEYGQASRILSPIVGSFMTYGSVNHTCSAAPGQLTLQEMSDIYRVQLLNRHTEIYALLGYPIAQSPGHLFHNQAFAQKNRNAVYVKLKLAPEILMETMPLFKELPFAGFSVTIPHKETIGVYLDELCGDAKETDAVNTIKVEQGRYTGFNTDGRAAVDVLEKKLVLADKQILILGAGGSAKAITHTLAAKGANITLCNRTLKRARIIAQKYKGDAIDFEQFFSLKKLSYDVIVNTLPSEAFIAQCANWEIPQAPHHKNIAMDIVLKPLDTLFLKLAKAANYFCIAGDALYEEQALQQLDIWFKDQ